MKNLSVLVAIILFSSCVTSQVTARDSESSPLLGNEELLWWHHPYYFPYFHPKPYWPIPAAGKAFPPLPAGFNPFHPKPHWPIPAAGKAFPPLPAGYKPYHPFPFHPPPVVTKCLSDCKDVRTCFGDIVVAFFTRKPAIASDCCASIQKMDEDCEKTVFGAFQNPFFNCFVKLQCSTKSTPSAPSPA